MCVVTLAGVGGVRSAIAISAAKADQVGHPGVQRAAPRECSPRRHECHDLVLGRRGVAAVPYTAARPSLARREIRRHQMQT